MIYSAFNSCYPVFSALRDAAFSNHFSTGSYINYVTQLFISFGIQLLSMKCFLRTYLFGLHKLFCVCRSEVLRIERELEEARSRLTAIRQAKYKKGENSPSDGEQDGFDSFNRYGSL